MLNFSCISKFDFSWDCSASAKRQDTIIAATPAEPYTRIVGVIPAGQLSLLLRDLRLLPTNWFETRVSMSELPAPLRSASPILITEVLPDPAPLPERPLVAGPQSSHIWKVSHLIYGTWLRKKSRRLFVCS